jgi:hypothetical protein
LLSRKGVDPATGNWETKAGALSDAGLRWYQSDRLPVHRLVAASDDEGRRTRRCRSSCSQAADQQEVGAVVQCLVSGATVLVGACDAAVGDGAAGSWMYSWKP